MLIEKRLCSCDGAICTAIVAVTVLMTIGVAGATDHPVTFINNCKQTVWVAATSKGPDLFPGAPLALAKSCDVNADCPTGSTCDGHRCTCTKPGTADPLCQGALCMAAGAKNLCQTSKQIPVPPAFQSGRVWGRTGCKGTGATLTCLTGDCEGKADCQGKSANRSTLWEITPADKAATGKTSADNYDASLVSGYNIPVQVVATIATDYPGWKPKATYQGGNPQSVIAAPAGGYTWLFNDVSGKQGTSGAKMPNFPADFRGQVSDGTNVLWSNTTSVCQTSTCVSDLLLTCPQKLIVEDPGSTCTPSKGQPSDKCGGAPCDSDSKCVIACDAPQNYCAGHSSDPICTKQNNSFFKCVNLITDTTDLAGNPIDLETPNDGTPICFNQYDCAPGTQCMTPTFKDTKLNWPTGAGLCISKNGVPQDGGCPPKNDGDPCPGGAAFTFPAPQYLCETVTAYRPFGTSATPTAASLHVCIPPITDAATGADAIGQLVWNADDFSATTNPCSADTDCKVPPNKAGTRCLEKTITKGIGGTQAVKQCLPGDPHGACVCYNPQYCVDNSGCHGGTLCLKQNGVPCAATAGCLCRPDAVYTGTCGPTNVNWTGAMDLLALSPGSNPMQAFKNACPSTYAYQFDDIASDWSCLNTDKQVASYIVTFCGRGGK